MKTLEAQIREGSFTQEKEVIAASGRLAFVDPGLGSRLNAGRDIFSQHKRVERQRHDGSASERELINKDQLEVNGRLTPRCGSCLEGISSSAKAASLNIPGSR
jgi:hypothetical protein